MTNYFITIKKLPPKLFLLLPKYPFFILGIKFCTAFFNRILIPVINKSGGGGCEMDFNHALIVQKVTFSPVHGTNAQNTKKIRFLPILVPYTKEKYIFFLEMCSIISRRMYEPLETFFVSKKSYLVI